MRSCRRVLRTARMEEAGVNAKMLAKLLRDRAGKMVDSPPFDGPERKENLDTAELIAVLARVVEGQSVRAAFGSPGDWGYESPIGQALTAAGEGSGTPDGVVTCVYCGHEYPQNTPTSGAEVLTEHIKVCEKHPMRRAEVKAAKLKLALIGIVGEDDPAKLREMEVAMLALPVPQADKAGSIAAIRVLIEDAEGLGR